MDFILSFQNGGLNVIEVPELAGKKVRDFRDYGNFWDVIGEPEYDPEEFEDEEEFFMSAPTMQLKVIRDAEGRFTHIELTVEVGEEDARGGTGYVEIGKMEAEKVVHYVLRGLGLE